MTISKPLLKAFFLLLCSSVLIIPASAAPGPLPKGDLYFGYSRTGTDTFYPNVGGLNGWEGAGHLKLHAPFIGIEADVAHYGLGSDSTVPRTTTYLFGPRVTVGLLGPRIFAHALIGGEHSANSGGPTPISGNAFSFALGGGFDFPVLPFFAWRIAGDYIHAQGLSPAGGTPARFSTGLVFKF